ncbi:amino acid ABC transporter substrate-binding protein (PAAT family) [Rhizobium sp. PP-F2F-G48]|uniref:transporter substrate-binding domain-containing protein n=1 Tax=Rhizobium sp. PP-F2F-G48 TaxID=2135651 RepID=UPI001044150C|nr:transporter substrate-binding domain-containing protein [Rhizobium sp. PP-F2F-G48]TCM52130.1 amino acid ABC transporter substrate-binding protein (PAAT family) [Rhizobium sp. PP-F2F-G48]
MIRRCLIAALLLGLVAAGPTLADDPVLRIGTEGAYPPFNFVNDKGELAGFDVDIAKALCKEMGRTCTFVATPWSEIIEGLEQNKYDLMVSSMAYTEERAKRIAYSEPYYRSHAVFIGDPKKYQDISPEGLAGARITAGKGTMQAQYLAKVYGKSTLVLGEDQPEAQALLEQGKADLMLGDAIELMSFLESGEGSAFEFIGDPVTNDFLQSTAHVTARKSDTALLEQVNAAIKKTRLDGSYERINDVYFPFSIY